MLLLIANIFFIYNIINLKIRSENIPSDMIDDALNILKTKGFIASRNQIPAKKPSHLIYEGIYSENIFADIVQNFSGISDEELKEADYMLVPAGISYSAGDYRFIFSDSDYFRIIIIEKSHVNTEKDFDELQQETEENAEMLLKNGLDDVNNGSVKKAENVIKNFIKKYHNQDIKLGFEIIGFKESTTPAGYDCVLITQMVDGLPIDAHTAYIEIQDGKVKYFSGEWYFGGFVATSRDILLDSVNILFKCIEIDGGIIQSDDKLEKMDIEYTVMPHDTGKFYLTPSWRLIFESEKKLSYNMLTGNKN